MAAPETKPADITYLDLVNAPHVYFDIAPAHGVMANAVEIELAARTLNPLSDGTVEVKFVTTARLRCSQAGAQHLRNALDAVLKMFEAQAAPTQANPSQAGPSQAGPSTGSKLN